MKTPTLALVGLSLVALCTEVLSQTLNLVGYVNMPFAQGYNLFGNPLQQTNNDLNFVFLNPPDGTSVSLWNPGTLRFERAAIFTSGLGWSDDLLLNPGTGALVYAPVAFTNGEVGEVLAPDGLPFTVQEFEGPGPLNRPPAFSGASGVYLLAARTAMILGSTNLPVFEYVVGRSPEEGEQFTWLDAKNQTYHTTMFKGGVWSNGDPVLPVGTAAFFSIYGSPSVASPALQISFSSNNVILTWPISAPDFILETSSNLSTGAIWTPVTNGITTNLNSFVLTNSASAASAFYRLHKQ
jgi:hypothetical protein